MRAASSASVPMATWGTAMSISLLERPCRTLRRVVSVMPCSAIAVSLIWMSIVRAGALSLPSVVLLSGDEIEDMVVCQQERVGVSVDAHATSDFQNVTVAV